MSYILQLVILNVFHVLLFSSVVSFCFVGTGFLCVVLTGIEFAYIDQTGIELTDSYLFQPLQCWD